MQLPESGMDKLLSTIKRAYGWNFTKYSQASLKYQITHFMQQHDFKDTEQALKKQRLA